MGHIVSRRRESGFSDNKDIDYSKMYFTIQSLEDGNVVSIKNVNCTILPVFYYSLDGGNTWNSITAETNKTKNVTTVDTGEIVLFKCIQTSFANDWNKYNGFQCSKDYIVYGNIMSLLYGDNFVKETNLPGISFLFAGFFKEDTHIIDASNFIFPGFSAPYYSYNGMFRDCINLKAAPKLPATSLSDSCYSSMFEGCINLLEAPELPATILAASCYQRMFCMDRNNKITTPKMTKGPVLPAKVLSNHAYREMFNGNGNLVEVTCLATNISAQNAVLDWLKNCSSVGVFKKNASMDSWPRSESGIPSGWTVEDYQET